jgi:hypothetical protein
METSPNSLLTTWNDQTSLQGASPVKISARPGYVQDSPVPVAASGESSYALFAVLDPDTSLWKTWPRCATSTSKAAQPSLQLSPPYLQTWPARGMMQSGQAYMPTSSAIRTRGNAASLLPTPMASDCHNSSTTYRRVQSRVDRHHLVGWIGIAVYLRHLNKGYANPRFSESLLGFPLDHSA